MKKLVYILVMLLTCLLAGNLQAGNGTGNRNQDPGELTGAETEKLVHIREEEKLARDVYTVLYETWGENIFLNISGSEQRHMDAMLKMLNLFDVPDPVGANGPGVFSDRGLQALYHELIELGNNTLPEAYEVGVIIEEMDIGDLQEAIAGTSRKPLVNSYSNLLAASINHLAAFVSHLNSLGNDYVSEFLVLENFGAEQENVDMNRERFSCGQPQAPDPQRRGR